jgi:uncharacterized phage protein (TIGR01671 family)
VWDSSTKIFRNFLYVNIVDWIVSGGDESNYVFQQYTGITDKTGKEVYEGDIVSFLYESSEHDVEKEIGEVFFFEGIFYFGKSLFASNDSNFSLESLEIIGNIFDNPEILK